MEFTKDTPPARFHDWEPLIEAALAEPGTWFAVPDMRHSTYSSLSRGANRKFLPLEDWEFRTSQNRVVDGRRLCTLHIKRKK